MTAATQYAIKGSILSNILKLSRNFSSTNFKYTSFQSFVEEKDRFNGITIDSTLLKCTKEIFTKTLAESLKKWSSDGRRCIWFKIHIEDSIYIPLLAQIAKQVVSSEHEAYGCTKSDLSCCYIMIFTHYTDRLYFTIKHGNKGFNFHHARDDFVMMYKWLPSEVKPNLPPPCHTNLGVGAFVINDKNQMLAVSEKHYEYPHWKLPGGYVERGEDIVNAAKREVKEETGVESTFLSLITFRHTHNMMYGNSDIYILLMMKALTEKIHLSQREVKDCQWMDIEEYINHPHVHLFNRFIIKQAFNCKERNIKLDLQKKTVQWATNTRIMDFLYVTEYD